HQLGAFTQVRNSATALDQNWANHEAVGEHLADVAAEITLAGSESGKIAYAFGGRYLDISGLHDQRIARLARQANADQRFRDYLLESYGLPDVYVDPEAQYWYARMSN